MLTLSVLCHKFELNVSTPSLRGYDSQLMVEVKEPKAIVEDVTTSSRLCHDIKNAQDKIVPTIEDVVTWMS
ncbi:hypothetical protein J1N35_011070 [Gossypium stocksii]|uniref:Uncharacterized protein n=1 Tax=Gossypium stocksii TaxID=47602 RepID=A0A9D3W261_9ROSI|nr:hypothetical protein J1N35_011070 [Gossypium stocksii]